MKTKVYCLASAKGGSGKTILCASFGAFLAQLDKKVLMIDVDAATYGLTLLYLNEVNAHREEVASAGGGRDPHGLFDGNDFSFERDIVHLPNNVSLLPATFSFAMKDTLLTADIDFLSMLTELLNRAKEQFDYVLLDAQAGTDNFSRIVMSRGISHEVVIVSEYDPLSAAGVERMKALLGDDLHYSRAWVLLNKMLPEFVATFSEFLEISKYLTPIPWDSDVVRAYARRRLPIDFEYGNQFTLAIMQSLKRLLGDGLSSEIDKWAEGRASSIREPIDEQYMDAENELKGLLQQKEQLNKKVEFRKLSRVIVSLSFLITIAIFLISDFLKIFNYDPFHYNSSSIKLILFMMIGLFTGILLFTWRSPNKSAEREVEEARFTRQLNIVEDRLKKLEVLRKADLDTLVKEGTTKSKR